MTEIDFYQLPRPVQDGLLDGLGGQFTPAPILARPGARRTVLAWCAVSYAAAVALLGLFAAGFGEVESRFALHPTAAVAAYVLLAATSVLGVIQALGCRARLKALPFQPGIYLFPANVIDARDQKLRVYPLAEVAGVSAGARGAVHLRFKGRSFSFPLADEKLAGEIVQRVEAARDHMRAGPDAAARQKLDPMEPPAVESPLAPPVPLSRRPSLWERRGLWIAAAAGTSLGSGLFYLHNVMSDNKMFARAQARDDIASYKSYLGRGRRHTDEVREVLLPRAELRAAMALGSVEAIDAFLRAYPSTQIQPEVDAARKAALLAEFERTRKAGTLAALLSFAERYPQHGIDKAFEQARHDIYARALARYKSAMPKGAEPRAEFVGRLLAYAERVGARRTAQGVRGPAVQIRFRRQASQDMDRAEQTVRKSPMFGGVTSLPGRYITGAALDPHEQRTAAGFAEGLARGFDPEILTFEPGPLLEGSGEEPLTVTAPTLAVSYRIESSGAAQATKKPRGIFLGLMLFFKADALLPQDPKPLTEKHNLIERVPIELIRQNGDASPPGTLESLVYGAMLRDGFADFQKRYLGRWLKP